MKTPAQMIGEICFTLPSLSPEALTQVVDLVAQLSGNATPASSAPMDGSKPAGFSEHKHAAEVSRVAAVALTPGMRYLLDLQRSTPNEFVRQFSELRRKNPALTASDYCGADALRAAGVA